MASASLVGKTSNKTPLLKLLINNIIIVSHLFPLTKAFAIQQTWLISATLINRETEKRKTVFTPSKQQN